MNILTIKIGKQRRKFIFIYIYYHENKSLKYLINILRMNQIYMYIVISGYQKDKLECQKNDNLLYASILNEILFKK